MPRFRCLRLRSDNRCVVFCLVMFFVVAVNDDDDGDCLCISSEEARDSKLESSLLGGCQESIVRVAFIRCLGMGVQSSNRG